MSNGSALVLLSVINIFGSIPFENREVVKLSRVKRAKQIKEDGCRDAGVEFKDWEFCGVYHICIRDDMYNWVKQNFTCADNKQYEDGVGCTDQSCADLQPYPKLPDDWKCDQNYDRHVDPNNCKGYYDCYWTGSYYTYATKNCDDNKWYNEVGRTCHGSDICPQDYLELPNRPGWHCERRRNLWYQHPEDCSKGYKCVRKKCGENMDKHCVEEEGCPEGQIFAGQDGNFFCEDGNCQTSVPEDEECMEEGELHAHPTECGKFYACTKCKLVGYGEWCYDEDLSCPDGQIFDDTQKTCVEGSCPMGMGPKMELNMCEEGRCPREPEPLPEGYICEKDGDKHQQPENCANYYTCMWVSLENGKEYWSFEISSCPEGQFFDESTSNCVDGSCPPEPGPLPEGYTCEKEGEQHQQPENCANYYTCTWVSLPTGEEYWSFGINSCPESQSFDESKSTCVEGRCPQEPEPLPEGYICEKEGEQHQQPENCANYYTCRWVSLPNGEEYWSFAINSCPEGQPFDESKSTCVEGRCPQNPEPLPEGYICEKEGDTHQQPDNCANYYTCMWVSLPNGEQYWGFAITSCPDGQSFDESKKTCVEGRCPQYPQPLPEGYVCEKEDDKHQQPDNCANYYTCMWVSLPNGEQYWGFAITSCPDGQSFDESKNTCLEGRCPQYPQPLPAGYVCEKEGDKHQQPDNCANYYTCMWVSLKNGEQYWSFAITSCPNGQSFDESKMTCTSERCPQYPPVLPSGPGWQCNAEEEKNVGEDCHDYYVCKTCPDSNVNRWCYELHTCPNSEFFNTKTKQCVSADRCPQLPPEKKCEKDRESKVNPEDCTKYYRCFKFDDQWVTSDHQCPPEHHFDSGKELCVKGECKQKRR